MALNSSTEARKGSPSKTLTGMTRKPSTSSAQTLTVKMDICISTEKNTATIKFYEII